MKGLVSVFLPVFNEERILEKNVMSVYGFLARSVKAFEIFIVDDGSTDSTPRVARELAKKKGIRYIRFENGPSRRENLAKSFSKAGGGIVVYMDADMATDLSFLPRLIEETRKGDIVIGSRYVKGAEVKRGFLRRIFSMLYNRFLRCCFGSKVRDHQCGFKAFRKKVILELIKDAGYDKKFVRGWFWDAEILIRAQRAGYRIAEIPVKWARGEKSSFNLRRELRMIPYVLKLWVRMK